MDEHTSNRLPRIFSQACDGMLSPAEHEYLQQLLLEDAAVRQEYGKFCQMQADMHFQVRARRAGKKVADAVMFPQDSLPDHPLQGQWSMGVIFLAGAVTATMAAALFLWLSARAGLGNAPLVAKESDRFARAGNSSELPKAEIVEVERRVTEVFVARIVRISSDLSWGSPSPPMDFLLRVKAGDKLNVAAGLVQLEFASGAKIILHGPAVFTPTSIATGKLESGRLTGEVADGNFQLSTPAADVNDLGTEFGVHVDSKQCTDVVVFNGKVQVIDTLGSRETIDMTQGMSARICSDGSKLFGGETEVDQFARFVPANTVGQDKNELSVVDVFCGGNGFNTGLSGAADPLSGKKDHGQQRPGIRKSNGNYHAVDWNPILDGVFMPKASGGRTVIDSLGSVVELPKNSGTTWGPIWARRWESALEDAGVAADFWGTKTLKNILLRLKQTDFGMMGMCANVGVTLDLRAVRLLQQRSPVEFRAIVSNLDNAEEDYPHDAKGRKRTADIRVYVDGELRHERIAFRRIDGDAPIVVKLTPEDRFLSIVSTDGDGDSSYDHVVLIDPVIVLEQSKKSLPENAEASSPRGDLSERGLIWSSTDRFQLHNCGFHRWIGDHTLRQRQSMNTTVARTDLAEVCY